VKQSRHQQAYCAQRHQGGAHRRSGPVEFLMPVFEPARQRAYAEYEENVSQN